jgi:hypothetical protein
MIALIAALAVSIAPAEPKERFTGGFIQLSETSVNSPTRLTAWQWRDVLASMKAAGLKTVVIQYAAIRIGVDDYCFMKKGTDAVETILVEAGKLGDMRVFVGLWNVDFPTGEFNEKFFKTAEEESIKTLKVAWDERRYGSHNSFAGWYIPIEAWNFKPDADKVKLLGGFLGAVRNACKARTPKPVAFCIYFNPAGFATPAQTTAVYKEVLAKAMADIMMLQDGVGEFGYSEADCRAYFAACKAACGTTTQFWADLECFTRVGEDRTPGTADRLARQIAAVKDTTETFVTFEFFHYMNPNAYADPTMCQGGPVDGRKKLYDKYLEWLTAPAK